ncbi:ATP-binding protein [Pseudomonas sp. P5_152]|uniref:ATP-binding protein n=1 Tax=Pseudomonas sp. P5_152 TaxID=3043442 RepID=UPI002A361F9A|nr:ATP-binding protein [Pseudomonas sp. P5_152]MDX9663755.1 ATP-binding protein [Pseudomonas sp. P5_152]
MRQCLHRIFLLFWLVGGASLAHAAAVELSAEERQWIALHPILRVGVVEDLIPFEYFKDGVLHGRSKQYLQFVTAATGLEFTYVPGKSRAMREQMLVDGQVDILSSHLRFGSEPVNEALKTLVYHTASPIIVTRVDHPDVFDIDQLQGRTVMVPEVQYYEQMFRERSIQATLIKSTSALDMLNRVVEGSADAAVATETFLMPYLYRRFKGVLETSGVVGSQMLNVSMAVREDQAVLISILEKALKSITAEQRKVIYEQWYQELDMEVPMLPSIVNHYLHVLILAAAALTSLCLLVYRGHRQRKIAVRNEQEKTMFLTVMSHEIRSPMNAVLAAMELLWHTRLNEQQRHLAHLANSGASALVRLLDDGLHTPDPGTRPLRLAIEPTDVTSLVEGVVGLHRLRAREKRLNLNPRIQAKLPLLLLDSSRLTQILHNLLSNAIKFTDAGDVDINVHLIASQDDSRQLQIEVRDTGIGVSKAIAASLFRPYARASHSSNRAEGTGLGLVICQQLVSLMGGELLFSSELDVGTTVTICLPATLASEPIAVPAIESPTTELADTGLQILVVEDTLANQEVLRAQISGFGCRPVVAADAAQATKLFGQRAYNLVLMDCDLPDQDGYSLVQELRAFELQLGRTLCPIIAISALTGDQHLQRCLDAGMNAVLSKPIRLGQLAEVIERWCSVKLAPPSASLMAPELDQASINREMAGDLGSLIKALALCDRPTALRVAHRLHGAALIMEWLVLGAAAERMELLLRREEGWGSPAYAQALEALVQQWQALSGDTLFDVLPVVRVHRMAPL